MSDKTIVEKYREDGFIPLTMGVDNESIKLFERLQGLFRSANKTSSIVEACMVVEMLATAQIEGWTIELHKPGYAYRVFRLQID